MLRLLRHVNATRSIMSAFFMKINRIQKIVFIFRTIRILHYFRGASESSQVAVIFRNRHKIFWRERKGNGGDQQTRENVGSYGDTHS